MKAERRFQKIARCYAKKTIESNLENKINLQDVLTSDSKVIESKHKQIMESHKIIDLDSNRARNYFFKNKSYINFELPDYINFEEVLNFTDAYMSDKSLNDVCKIISKRRESPGLYEGVNHILLSNKEGLYSWRPLHIIHPILYVNLVRELTKKANWLSIQKRFEEFSKAEVHCISVPRESDGKQSDKASLVRTWWERIEQDSIKKSLEFNYLFKTDITDCYGSIYTHAVEWALDPSGREAVKKRIEKQIKDRTLGGFVDKALRDMSRNQTNGIPQGSDLMDFIAEIVLGYADKCLTEKIKEAKVGKDAYYIIRFRDDYRIFIDDPNVGRNILKLLSETLRELGMKLNASKTYESGDIILSSIKQEKLERILIAPAKQYLQKESLRIYQISRKYPSSGIISKELGLFYDRINEYDWKKNKEDLESIITIFAMIAFYNPKVINWASAIISVLLDNISNRSYKKKIAKKIYKRFRSIPNTGLLDVWLQRITEPQEISFDYPDKLTSLSLGKIKNSELWNCSWLVEDAVNIINVSTISTFNDKLKNKTISSVISREEVELFKQDYF